MQNGRRPIYEKPESFFAVTFPMHNLRNLVRDVMLRLRIFSMPSAILGFWRIIPIIRAGLAVS